MNIQQVIYVMAVNDYHSFTEAAKSLYISQPRLSQAIRELEEELGFEIFVRNRKGISGATVKGAEFLRQSRILLRQFSALESLKERNMSTFHLASTLVTQAQDAFIKLCKEVSNDPLLNMDIWFCGCCDAATRIKSMASDLGVVAILDDQMEEWLYYFKSNNIDYHELTSRDVTVTISKSSPLASKDVIMPEDLRHYTYIAEKCSRMNDLSVKMAALLEKMCPEARILVSNTYMMYTLVSESPERAFTFEPVSPSPETLEKFGLVSIPFGAGITAHLGYIHPAERRLCSIAIRYLELLHKELCIPFVPLEGSSL